MAVRLHTFLTTSLPPVHRAQLLHQGNWRVYLEGVNVTKWSSCTHDSMLLTCLSRIKVILFFLNEQHHYCSIQMHARPEDVCFTLDAGVRTEVFFSNYYNFVVLIFFYFPKRTGSSVLLVPCHSNNLLQKWSRK